MADTNPYEVLEREKSSPAVKEMETLATPVSGRTSEASPALQLKGDEFEPMIPAQPPEEQHAPTTPSREPGGAYKVDLGKAPGTISYAEATKKHVDTTGQWAREAMGEPVAGKAAKEKARELGPESVDTAREQAGRAREAARQHAEAARERGAEVANAAKEYVQVAAEKTSDIASAAGEKVKSAVEAVKDHLPSLPRVERAESTSQERDSKQLLDEALALAEGTTAAPYYEPRPELYAPVAPASAPAPSTGASAGAETAAAYEAGAGRADRWGLLDIAAEVGATTLEGGKAQDSQGPPTVSTYAPDELARRAEREDINAQGPLQAAAEKLKGAVEYVKEHMLPTRHQESGGPAHSSPPGSPRGRVHEYRALPGDVHIPLVTRAVREHVLPGHKEPAAEGAKKAVSSVEAKTEETFQAAKEKAGAAAEGTSGLTHSAAHSLAGAYHTVPDKTSGAVHEVEERVKWTVDHTKEKLHERASQWQEEIASHNLEELKLSHGEVPSNTEELLKARGGGNTQATAPASSEAGAGTLEPDMGTASGAPMGRRVAEKLQRLTPSKEEVKEAGREALAALDAQHPGVEGEIGP